MSEELTTERLEALRSIEDANIITPSTAHMEAEELRAGVHQMVADLHRLAKQDGCIAAAWALEALTVQVAEIERLRRERETLAAAVRLREEARKASAAIPWARPGKARSAVEAAWAAKDAAEDAHAAALALLDGEKDGGGV